MTESKDVRSEDIPGDLILTATPGRLGRLRFVSAPLLERGYNALEVDCLKQLPDIAQLCTHQHVMVIADFASIVGDEWDPEDPSTYAQSYREFLLSAYAPLRGMLRSQSKTCDLVILHSRYSGSHVGFGDFVSGEVGEDSGQLVTMIQQIERLAKETRGTDRNGGRWVV